MALVLADRVQETTNTTGTGTLTLAGAVSGYQSFSAIGNANTTYYTIQSGTDWEVGLGTYTSAGTTLSRDTVLASSASGAKITVAAGAKVFCDYPATKAAYIDGNTTLTVPTLACTATNSVTPVLSFNATNSIASFGSTTANSYNQLVIQNKSASAGASTNYVLSNDSGTDTTFYGEFGMNSSAYTATTYTDYFSMNNGVYFSSHDGDVTVGSGNGFKTYFAWGTAGQSAHVINASGAIGLNTNLGTSAATTGTTNFGTAGQKLQSAGSAATAVWASSPLATAFTTGTAATYTVPAGCTQLKITVQGPGGTGGASATGRATGGSAGSTCIKWLTVTPGGTLTYTVGTAAGTASTVSSGTITITTISAGSGTNGTSTAYAASLTAGTTGGAATGGDINIVGMRGGNSYGSSTTITTNFSGAGGNSPFGAGGQALSMVATAGQAATGFGGGGGGAHGNATGGAATGGIIIFETY